MRRFLLGILMAALVGVGASPVFASEDRLYDIAAILSGTFDGSTPGNHLRLDIRNLAIDPQHPTTISSPCPGSSRRTTSTSRA